MRVATLSVYNNTSTYNKTQDPDRSPWTRPLAACITKLVAAGGRPTDDPKGTLVAVRLSARQVHVLEQRARREDIGLSEALRRCVDEWAAAQPRTRPSTRTKPEAFKKQVVVTESRPARRRTRGSAK